MDFADLTPGFFDDAITAPARKGRVFAVNLLSGIAVTVVFTRLGSEAISVVSMRPANRKERNF